MRTEQEMMALILGFAKADERKTTKKPAPSRRIPVFGSLQV